MSNIYQIVALSAVLVESLTFITLKSDLLRPIIDKIRNLHTVLEQLLSCGYCTSFWFTLIVFTSFSYLTVEPITFVNLTTFDSSINYLIGVFLVHRCSNLLHGAIDKYLDKSYDKRYHSKWDSFKSEGE